MSNLVNVKIKWGVVVDEEMKKLAKLDSQKEKFTNGNDKIDVKKFNTLPEVQEVIRKLKQVGVTRKWLMENYTVAGMILIF